MPTAISGEMLPVDNVSVVRFADPKTMPPGTIDDEYVTSLTYGYTETLKRGRRTLPRTIDGLQRGVRFDIYETMMKESQVKSCIGLLIAGILGGGLDILPASEAADPDYENDTKVAKFCHDALLKHCKTPFMTEFLPDMLKAIALGHRIAEKVCYKIEDSPVPGKLIFERLKVKPRRKVAFIVDEFLNVVGIAAPPQIGETTLQVFDPEKFAVFTWRPSDCDPRGTSELESVYEPYWDKQKLRPMHLQFLHQFASPSLVGILSESQGIRPEIDPATQQPKIDPNTGKPIWADRSVKFMKELEKFQNSSIIVIPHGAEIKAIEVKGDGRAFIIALAQKNLEITKGILFQTLATELSDNGSGRQSDVHADSLDVVYAYGIDACESFIEREFLRPLVEWNEPPGTAVPRARLPGANKANFLAWASAVAKLDATGYLDPSQYDSLDAALNLPKRSTEGLKQAIEAKKQERSMAGQPPALSTGLPPGLPPGSNDQSVGKPAGKSNKASERAKVSSNI